MRATDLRIALFSGNYNYVRDGANQALNRLVEYLLRQGAAVRVYSPTVATPAFPPTGDLVSVPSAAIPGRPEYRIPLALTARLRADLADFAPNVIHISSPDRVARQAAKWARDRNLPVVASVHTRFETYFQYYHLGFMEPVIEGWLRKLYRRCDTLIAPSQSMVDVLRDQRMNDDIRIWSRGVDRGIFGTDRRAEALAWRRDQGIADDAVVIGFLGRLVMEKGLDVFSDAVAALVKRRVPHRVLVIGEGPARDWFAARLPADTLFAGFQQGRDLGRAVAAMDVLLNPSITETFGNVTLEAMASGVAVVAASATGATNLITDGVTGRLVPPRAIDAYADVMEQWVRDPAARHAIAAAAAAESRHYDWDAINQTVVDTYAEVIARHTPR